MKILFLTSEGPEERFVSPRETIDDANSNSSTLEFKGTEIDHVERDDQNVWTIYTKGHHFYIIMTVEDVERIAALGVTRREEDMDLEVVRSTDANELLLWADYKHLKVVEFNRPVQPHEKSDTWHVAVAVEHLWPGLEMVPWHTDYKDLDNKTILVAWSNDNEERLISPKLYASGEITVDYQRFDVGDIVYYDNAAPGVGHALFRVDRKDDEGLWGICLEDTRWIPDGAP